MTTKRSIAELVEAKQGGRKIKMLTAYDFPLARLLDKADVDLILVGDSLANVVLGLESTTSIGMDEMIYHAAAVCRGVEDTPVVGDMPSGSCPDPQTALINSRRFLDEAGCAAVKVEWFEGCPEVIKELTKNGVPVMGHIGLTPQTAASFAVQGKDVESAKAILNQAGCLEELGCFAVVLECVPQELAQMITGRIRIPTIGIGAGVYCDGQVLVTHDLLGLYDRFRPKFVKCYAELGEAVLQAVNNYAQEVEVGDFPAEEHSFRIDKTQLDQLKT